ncbi:hypothetical protein NUU61_001786 [Penicillium alfredii]|uniref:Uncharacterized protein n=1 Tax=Penicillium alfredii TaxID=1506179 RepID=A0A9W9FQB4_9EURO|nr:uncharacterized protein NUU61_001786 [Penicillium alfredii]KAJ5104439.1 hypothetical protein NUU61_001786 [Penicillium alfredii]
MKSFHLYYLALLVQTALAQDPGVPTREIPPGARISNNEIRWTDPGCDHSQNYPCDEVIRRCYDGQRPALTPNQRHFACCGVYQQLRGSVDTEFHCCPEGHDVVGSRGVGYKCCPAGQTFNGSFCEKVCQNGKKLVNGECACPPNTVEAYDGSCQVKKAPAPVDCASGLQTGKCYTFKSDNANHLSHHGDGKYHADSASEMHGKFQLCRDGHCTPGLPVNPSDQVFIRDLHTGPRKWGGYYPATKWLSFCSTSGHVYRQDDFTTAGQFSLSKWPCGKYCLAGFQWGLGPAVPTLQSPLSFYDGDDQMCVPFELKEVPCDIHSDQNNCVWRNGEKQCCGNYGCIDKEL